MHRKGLKRNHTMSHSPIRGGQSARRERGLRAAAVLHDRRGRHARPGFSLLELTLVLAIIAALMGVAAFALLGQGTRAKITASSASLRILQTAINQYQLNHSVYPDKLDSLVSGQYVEARSMVDAWKRPFYYRTPGMGGRTFSLMSGGPDGDFSTPADNIDVWLIDTPAGGQ